jgi:uridylate kinase
VDGIYTADPMTGQDATKYDCISYLTGLELAAPRRDATGDSLCMDNRTAERRWSNMQGAGSIRRVGHGRDQWEGGDGGRLGRVRAAGSSDPPREYSDGLSTT